MSNTDLELERQIAREEKARFVRFLSVLVRHRRRILGTALGAALLALLFGLLRPDVYRARTVLYVGEGGGSATQLLAARLQGGLLAGLGGGGSSNSQLIGLILQSRSLADSLVARFGTAPDAEAESMPDGSIVIEVDARDPERAAEVAATYPVLINKLVADVGRQMRERREASLEQQLEEARERLESVEKRAVEFQQTVSGPGLEEQVTASVTAAIQLQRLVSEQEIVVQRLRRTATPQNPDLRAAEAELAARRQQLRAFMSEGGGQLLLPSFEESPELQVAGTRLLRDYTEAQEIYSSISASLSSLQVTGSEELPAVSVLDPAIVPEAPVNLKLWLILPIALILGLIAGAAGAFAEELSRSARRDPAYEPLFAAWKGEGEEPRGERPASGALPPPPLGEDRLPSEG